jgi:ATP-dependent protease ClpP protease subunit
MPLNIAHRSPSQAAVSSRITRGTLEICLYATIGGGADEISSQSFKAMLHATTNYSRIALRINSHGSENGGIKHALSIRRQLTATGKKVTAKVEGCCSTAAAIVATAADTVVMGTGSCMCLDAGFDDKKVVEALAQRSGQSREIIAAMLADERLLTAEECRKLGLCDHIR